MGEACNISRGKKFVFEEKKPLGRILTWIINKDCLSVWTGWIGSVRNPVAGSCERDN
jgi:hypothetical protein